MRRNLVVLAMSALLLSACGGDADQEEGGAERSASGEILEGSISDAMIATDSLQSQPPLVRSMPQAEGEEGDGLAGDAAGEAGAETQAPALDLPPEETAG